MAQKALKKKVQPKGSASKLTDQVLDSARDVWLAGLGAFSLAQKEGGKLVDSGVEQGSKLFDQGNHLFEKLVNEGAKIENNTRKDVEGTVVNLRGGVENRVELVRKQASGNLDKLENLFEERIARVLGRLGVPTADDVNKLSARVQKLSDMVARLAEQPAAVKAAPKAAKKASRKPVAKKPVAKKPAAKPAVKTEASKAA